MKGRSWVCPSCRKVIGRCAEDTRWVRDPVEKKTIPFHVDCPRPDYVIRAYERLGIEEPGFLKSK